MLKMSKIGFFLLRYGSNYTVLINPYSTQYSSQILLSKSSFPCDTDVTSRQSWRGHYISYQTNDLRARYLFEEHCDHEFATIFVTTQISCFLRDANGSFVFIDIGANYGSYSAPIYTLGCNVVLVEPNPFISYV